MLFTGAPEQSIPTPTLSNDQLAKALEAAKIKANNTQHPAFNHQEFSPTETISTRPAAKDPNILNEDNLNHLVVR